MREGTVRVLDRSDGLILHREDASELLAELAAGVVELAGGILLGDDPKAEFPALADVGPLEVVEVACVGIVGDDRADGEFQGASSQSWASSWCLTTEDAAGVGD